MWEMDDELAWESDDESDIYDLIQAARPVTHSISMIWQSMPAEQKAYLKGLAKSYLRELREDPRGLLTRIAMMAGYLMIRKRVPPKSAVRQATQQAVRQRRSRRRQLALRTKVRRPSKPPPPRPMQSRWQRGRKGNRFEDEWL